MTENDFKTRFNNHKLSFRNRNHSHDTVLSKYIWDLKDNDTTYDIKWRIIKKANAYKGNSSRCNLCLSKKLCILTARDTILNKRSELLAKCRHENKFFATNHRKRYSNRPWISNFHPKTESCFQNFKSDDRLVRETPSYDSINFYPFHLYFALHIFMHWALLGKVKLHT